MVVYGETLRNISLEYTVRNELMYFHPHKVFLGSFLSPLSKLGPKLKVVLKVCVSPTAPLSVWSLLVVECWWHYHITITIISLSYLDIT